MHRTLSITVPVDRGDAVAAAVAAVDGVIGVQRHRGASVKPPGDVLAVTLLNRDADAVLRAVSRAAGGAALTLVSAEVASITDPAHQHRIDRDVDEAIWEELEAGLRHQGRLTPNFLGLMALGGTIGAAGAVAEPGVATVAYVASAIVAPAFEPLAKLPLGLVLRRWEVLRAGIVSTLAGYLALVAAAALTWLLLSRLGGLEAEAFLEGDALKHTLHPTPDIVAVALAGAFAGVLIQSAYRRSVIAGALVAMRLIEAAAVAGIAAGMGR